MKKTSAKKAAEVHACKTTIDTLCEENPYKRFHRLRWEHCLYLLMKELIALDDERVTRILDRYTVRILPFKTVGLLFPRKLKETDLPKKLRLVNAPKVK